MNILLTGGTGLLGRALCAQLQAAGHSLHVLSRRPEDVAARCGADVRPLRKLDEWQESLHFDAIINLAGAPIVDLPWTSGRKRVLRDSRIGLTRALIERLNASERPPSVLLSASAIGIYGERGEQECNEESPLPAGEGDFASALCRDWEAAALAATASGLRVCLLRTGLVLAPDGGLLARMKLPFRLGLGGRLGKGDQWMSWIHIDDWVAAVCQLLADNAASGAWNLCAPTPVRNDAFTRELAASLHRPACLHQPAFLLRAVLGQRAGLVLGSQKVLPAKLLAAGFHFRHPVLSDALRHCC